MKPAIVVLAFSIVGMTALASPRPQDKNDQAALQKEAKISMQQAQKTALDKEPGKIKSKELERENGKLIYSFDIKTKTGIHEVNVDGVTGEVLEDSVESPSAEANEKKKERKQHDNTQPQNPPSPY